MSPLYCLETTLYHKLNKIMMIYDVYVVCDVKQPSNRDTSGVKILNLL